MKRNTKQIEEKAVCVLKSVLLNYHFLEPHIETNDRTPSWDGEVLVYGSDDQKKSNLRGRVPVQVKGISHGFSGDATFQCNAEDLRNYYHDGGCLFFVVSVEENSSESKIYYRDLSVCELKSIIEMLDAQKTYTIRLHSFPDKNTEVSFIFYSFIENRQKQMCMIGKDIPELATVDSCKFESFSFNVTGVGLTHENVLDFVSMHEHLIYGKAKGIGIDVPIAKCSIQEISCGVNAPVIVNGKEYYSSYTVSNVHSEHIVRIGKSITLYLPNECGKGVQTKLEFKPSAVLSELIRDEEFLVDVLSQKEFLLGSDKIILNELTNIPLESYKAGLKFHQDVKKALDAFGVTEKLNLDGLTTQDETRLRMLVGVVLNNTSVDLRVTSPLPYGTFRIANLVLLVWWTKLPNGQYKLENFFSKHAEGLVLSSNEDQAVAIQPSLLLNRKVFVHLSNLNYQRIYEDVCNAELTRLSQRQIVLLALELLSAYDGQDRKDVALLELAEKIVVWLEGQNGVYDKDLLLLNKLQIVKRQRVLSFDEKKVLMRFTDENFSLDIQWAAYVLLDEHDMAKKCFVAMNESTQEILSQMPLYNLYKIER